MTNTLLSAINGWFAGLLVVMIIITLLFGFILFIALKPVHKEDQQSSAQKALARRETELAVEMVELMNDAPNEAKRAELEKKMREVKSAQKLVNELMGPDESAKPAAQPAKPRPAKNNNAPKANGEQAKPVRPRPAQPAKEAVKPEAKPASAPKAAPKAKPEVKPAEEVKKAPEAAEPKDKE